MPSPGEGRAPGRRLFALGAGLAALAVALGAFGTHALEARVAAGRLETWDTAVRYHLVHALALLVLALALDRWGDRGLSRAGTSMALGTLIFSGSLYLLVLTDTPVLGAVTPVGGVLLVAGWLLAAWSMLRPSPSP